MKNIIPVVILCLFLAESSGAVTNTTTYKDYTTCAVYHRMLASDYIMRRQMPLLAQPHTEKTQLLLKAARELAEQSSGAGSNEVVDAFWASEVKRMEDIINRQFSNVFLLKDKYGDRCSELSAAATD